MDACAKSTAVLLILVQIRRAQNELLLSRKEIQLLHASMGLFISILNNNLNYSILKYRNFFIN